MGKLLFFFNYSFKLEVYRPPCISEDIEKAIIKAEDIIKLYKELQA
jgi:hypothetical protein